MFGVIGGILLFVGAIVFATCVVAVASPKTLEKSGGKPMERKEALGGGIFALAIGAVGLVMLVANSGASTPSVPAAQPSPSESLAAVTGHIEPWLRPEDIVVFPKGMAGCFERGDLQAVTELIATGRSTKMLAYFDRKSEGGLRCVMLPANRQFKVIDAEANNPKMPDVMDKDLAKIVER